MFFKKDQVYPAISLLVSFIILGAGTGFSEVVDCIVARVNADIITLSDIRILQAFGIGRGEKGRLSAEVLQQILEEAINRKIVIELVSENITVTDEEVDRQLQTVMGNLGPAEWQNKLDEFGLEEDDLKPYLRELLVYERIISLRFSQSVTVSLGEIENYYAEVYLAAQKAKGEEPKPMIQILDDLESEIRREKTESQVSLWMMNLRQQAEVYIHVNCLEQARLGGGKG